jgi:aminoglycoside N3'-acetyltransferase
MQQSTKEYFLSAMRRVLPENPGILVMHSSLPDLMPPEDFVPSSAIRAFEELVEGGWTIALPAFTFSFCRDGFFSEKHSLSETGKLADVLLQNAPRAQRTPHPIYSFAVIGPRSSELMACPSTTTFGNDSPFGLFEREQATIAMLGCTWAFNTQIHRYEELAAVPYRYPKVFVGNADFGAGTHPAKATMWVRDLDANPINDFSLAERNLRDAGLIKSEPLWRETVESVSAADVARICRADLAADPYAYVANARAVSDFLGQNSRPTAAAVLKS